MIDNAYLVIDCLCGWYDLLGYGGPFRQNNWDLRNKQCEAHYKRIRDLHIGFLIGLAVKPLGTRLVFNDGFASTIDISSTNSTTFLNSLYFLEGLFHDFNAINAKDKRNGFPGVRGVITAGQRFSYDSGNTSFDVTEERTVTYSPIEFQMNTAFSKAFLMEESGKRAGLSGNTLFIDVAVYEYIKTAARTLGFKTPEITETDSVLTVKVFGPDNWFAPENWFADVTLDKKPINYGAGQGDYNNQGITTTLYRFIDCHSYIDDYAKEGAHNQALRYSKIEDDDSPIGEQG